MSLVCLLNLFWNFSLNIENLTSNKQSEVLEKFPVPLTWKASNKKYIANYVIKISGRWIVLEGTYFSSTGNDFSLSVTP